MENSTVPEGTILVIREGVIKKLYYIEDLMFMNELTIGQVFIAVANANNKKPDDYGSKWIPYLNHQYEVSNMFIMMKKEIDACETDFDKMLLACAHLGEDALVAIPVAELKK